MLSQRQQQKFLQKLSPQQIQMMKLFQIPTFALEQRIEEELETNPALEEGGNEDDYNEDADYGDSDDNTPDDNDKIDDFNIEDYINEDDIPDYKLYVNNQGSDYEEKTTPIALKSDFNEFLISQLGLRVLTEKQETIAMHIIGNLDDAGYLSRDVEAIIDDLVFLQNLTATINEVLEVLDIIQDFDPPGVATRDLRECLLVQLIKKEEQSRPVLLATQIIKNHFEEFSKKHYEKILLKLSIQEKELKEAIDEVLKLNPKPGSSFIEDRKSGEFVIPDFIVSVVDGELVVTLNSRNAPDLRLSRKYSQMLEDYSKNQGKNTREEKDAILFVRQKIDSARWFIDAIQQRQQTFMNVITSLLKFQQEFFLTGDESRIKPMVLKNIADDIQMDVSTVSRVTSSKYVQTPYGTYLLKHFFSESLHTDSGEDASTIEVKMILKELIEAENKTNPVTDQELEVLLKDKGYNVARRTLAKYRELLGIPVARLRREM